MSKICILGAGAMGSAFSFPCGDSSHETTIIGTQLENNFIDELKKNKRFHPSLNCSIPDSINLIQFNEFNFLKDNNIDLLVIGVSSKGIEWIADQLSKVYQNKEIPPLLMLTKGLSINNNNYEVLVDKLKRLFKIKGINKVDISAVAGPCLASGLANRIHTSVIIANEDINAAKKLTNLFKAEYYHTSYSDDLIGVEVCAAIKNIFSMVIGASKGICSDKVSDPIKEKNYLNTASALINQSIYEMEIFTEYLNGKKQTVIGLAGLGDLYVSSGGGRNSKMGSYLGDGIIFSQAKKTKMEKITIEGADLIYEIGEKVKKDFNDKKLPLFIGMINAILEDKKLVIKWENFNS